MAELIIQDAEYFQLMDAIIGQIDVENEPSVVPGAVSVLLTLIF